MNNTDRNTRTLIVSFMVAIFALIPLRFVEAGQQFELNDVNNENVQVLGESIETVVPEVKIEAPYDEIEACMDEQTIKDMELQVVDQLENEELTQDEKALLLEELGEMEAKICR